jgi:hypothetical protein
VSGAVVWGMGVGGSVVCSRTDGMFVYGGLVVLSSWSIEVVDPLVLVNNMFIGFEVKLSGDVPEKVVLSMF